MGAQDMHLICKAIGGHRVVTWCGLVGVVRRSTHRYQEATCGKCRREYRKEN